MEEEQTIAAIAAADPNFSILVTALDAADLVETFDNPEGDFTVFAPTNAAFADLAAALGYEGDAEDEEAVFAAISDALAGLAEDGNPIPLLTDVLTYHAKDGEKTIEVLTEQPSVTTLLGTLLIPTETGLIDADPDGADPAYVEGATDIMASNGIIQAIDGVLRPIDLPDPAPETTLAGLLTELSGDGGFDEDDTDFDLLLAALEAADLVDAVSAEDADLTVFAPTDAAFVALAEALGATPENEEAAFNAIVATLTDLAEDDNPIPLLTDILTYHVLDGALGRVAIAEAESLTSLNENASPTPGAQTLGDAAPGLDDPAFIDAASNLVTTNGIAHAIDGVLLPFDPSDTGGEGPTDGDDRIVVGPEDTEIDAGAGTDTVVFDTAFEGVEVEPVEGGFAFALSEERTVTVLNAEFFEFTDATLEADMSDLAASVARLYVASLGRNPDVAGTTFWIGVAEDLGIPATADFFVASPEFEERFGADLTDNEYIDQLYLNVLGREADEPGEEFWLGVLEQEQFDEGDLLAFFSESQENAEQMMNVTEDGVLVFA